MNKTITSNRFNYKRDYQDVYNGDKPMTRHQRRTLEELIYSRISNSEEQDRRINELESYDFRDAQEMIDSLVFAKL